MKKTALYTLTIVILYLPFLVYGNTTPPPFKTLVGIPNVDPAANFSNYINQLYILSISIAALLAVIKIVIAGVKYMLTDIVTTKGAAKKDIEGAIIGLLIVLAAVLILTVINPKITNVSINFQKLDIIPGQTGKATNAVLDTSKVTTVAIAGTNSTIRYLTSTDQKQKDLFTISCRTHGTTSKTGRVYSGTIYCLETGRTSAGQKEVLELFPGDENIMKVECEKNKNGKFIKVNGVSFCYRVGI